MSVRRVHATFIGVERVEGDQAVSLRLRFRPERTRQIHHRIEHWLELGPEATVRAVEGIGILVRILRAARVAPPADPLALLERPDEAEALLERAEGAAVVLRIRPRRVLRFLAWTETGVEVVEDVSEVQESHDAFYVKRRGDRFPVRVPREIVLRRRTETERWFEVVEIERVPPPARARGAA